MSGIYIEHLVNRSEGDDLTKGPFTQEVEKRFGWWSPAALTPLWGNRLWRGGKSRRHSGPCPQLLACIAQEGSGMGPGRWGGLCLSFCVCGWDSK